MSCLEEEFSETTLPVLVFPEAAQPQARGGADLPL
jgi:hypothetical protein